jgi:2-polyprenyl-3-methyl-5-hydroxy-6-metoxy-1,4-benzoquinol methylase
MYRRAVADVMRFISTDAQHEIARHDRTLEPGRHDLRAYLLASETRYVRVLRLFARHGRAGVGGITTLDVGGFLGAFPLALARMGVSTTLVEQYGFYHGALDGLHGFLQDEGVAVVDRDFNEPGEPIGSFSLVTSLAVLEHLASSPRVWLENLRDHVAEGGLLVVDVPNIAYWPNRLRLLRGETIHQDIGAVYESDTPYMGHHREYTTSDLKKVMQWSGLEIEALEMFNYSVQWRDFGVRGWLRWGPQLAPMLLPSCREVLMAAARPRST